MFDRVRLLGFLLVFVAFLSLSGCCTFRSCESSHIINVSATEELNSCSGSSQHPVTLRIFGLTNTVAFNQASFDELWHAGESTLGSGSAFMIEKVILPGQAISLESVQEDGVVALGVVANFCSLEPNCWRKTIKLGKNTQEIEIQLANTCLTIK